VRRFLTLALVLLSGCVGGGGDVQSGTKDASADGGDGPLDGTLFPLDDANDETVDSTGVDTTASPDTTPTPDTSPTCGAVGQPCCSGSVCNSGNYCYSGSGTCFEKPWAVEEGSDPGACADLGVTHIKPAFFERFIVHGRPGALAYRYYIKVSCGTSAPKLTPESPLTITGDGTYTFVIENTATSDCTNGNLGKYEVWFVVDGQETKHLYQTVFNSLCTSVKTCALGATACP